MTSKEQTAYEMECALAEQIESQVSLSSEQLYYMLALVLTLCIERREDMRPVVLHEVGQFSESIIPNRTIRFQPLMQKRLDDLWCEFKSNVIPYLSEGVKSRPASIAARDEAFKAL